MKSFDFQVTETVYQQRQYFTAKDQALVPAVLHEYPYSKCYTPNSHNYIFM